MKKYRAVSTILLIFFLFSPTMSTYAQIICGFEEDGLGGLRVLGDYAIVSDGKLNFDFPAKKENSIDYSYVYKQHILLESNFSIDFNVKFENPAENVGCIFWRDYTSGSTLSEYHMIDFSNGNMIFTDGSTYSIPNHDFVLKIEGNREKLKTYIDGVLINDTDINKKFGYDNSLELRLQFSNTNVPTGKTSKVIIDKETVNRVAECIDKLPPIYRDVILLEKLHHNTKEEIAKLLNINYETVRKRSLRARKMLIEALEKEDDVK